MTGIYHDTITQDIQFFLLDIQKTTAMVKVT